MADRHAEGSSSGTGHSDDSCTIQVNAYVKNDAKLQAGSRNSDCTPVMVSITGSSGLTERRERNPIDVVLVLHVHIRYAAPANWHDLVNRATGLLVEKLGDKDRLAVVPALLKGAQIVFGDAVIAPIKPRLLQMSAENKAAAREAVESSEAMRTNSPLMRDLESAESILYGRRSDEKEERAGYIIVISNSNEDLSSVLSWRFRSVHAFGFHSAHNARAMHAIINRGDSTYAVLDKVEGEESNSNKQIAQAFTAIVDKITADIEPMEIRLKCNEEVLLSEIYAPRICNFISYDKKVGIIWAHARGPSVATNFIILLEIPEDYYEYHNLLEVHAKFGQGHPPDSIDRKGTLVPVRKGVNGSIQVAAEIVRMQALRIVTEITDDEDHRNDKKLSNKLYEWHRNLQELNFGTEAAQAEEVKKLALEMQEMQKRLERNNLWLEYMLSWQSYQWWPLRPLIKNGKYATSVDSGVNYNMQATTDHNSLVQTRIWAKVDAIPVPMQKPHRGIPVLVHIKVPSDLEGKQRVPIDLVAVLDVRKEGSDDMNEQKLKLLNKVMGFLMVKLSDKDRLSIVSVHSANTESAVAFQHMTIQGRSECMKVLSALTSASKAAQQASQRRDQPSTSRKALCLPMATVNSPWIAVYGSSTLSKSLKDAVKRLDDRDDKTAMGLIMIISDTDDEHISVSHRTLSPYYAIHAFSLCSVDNARAMYRIASRSMGIYGILLSDALSSSNEIAQAFRAFISNITSTIAVNTEVNIVCDDSSGAKLSTIESGHFKSRINHDKKSGVIYAGALYPGAERRFLVYVEKVGEDEYGRMSKMLAVTATCWQHGQEKDKSDEQKMVVVRGKDPGSKELVEEIIRIEEVKMLSAIADPKTKTELVLRKMQELRKRLKTQQAADYAMAVDEESLASLASDKDGSRLSYMLSWLSFQGLCEQPPPVPAPTTPRRETDQNSPQPHGHP